MAKRRKRKEEEWRETDAGEMGNKEGRRMGN